MVDESKRPHVLIVDDVVDNVRLIHHALKEEPYSFGIAASVEELFMHLEKRIPTLILLDVMLPDGDGFEAARRILEREEWQDIPILFITARSEQEDILRGFQSGGVDYITKPFDNNEVRARVRTHIRLRQAIEKERLLNRELQAAIARIRKLEGIIPICSHCKKIRDDAGYWTQVEKYISEHTGVMFSHSLCPECAAKFFPQDVLTDEPVATNTKG
ncbi:response regulator [Treponema sp. J25]|uniref:response regulator n=1 Tax=Treponema sp. J25 TaxID=2094121 RepID=UPI0010480135|nr:response regulator [Treponema sp. J25]TCW61848.1 response regulator [Treponema sp. J25]